MNIKFKKLTKTAHIPTRGSEEAAGYDLYADTSERTYIAPHTTVIIDTGLSIAIPQGYFGGIYARSGISSKRGLRPANCTGVIDADYRGPIKVALHNDTDEVRIIESQERIAQLIITAFASINFTEVDNLEETDRGTCGFGSTGSK